MTVLDTSGAVDLLLGGPAAAEVDELLRREREVAAPDVVVFETLAVLRRATMRGELDERRAAFAVQDLAALPLALFPAMPLRARVFELRDRLTAADALFVALAEALAEPLATKDAPLARAARTLGLDAIELATLGRG